MHYLPSMFIPFALHGDLSNGPDESFNNVLANRFLFDERRYGIVFDRFRIAYFADTCLRAHDDRLSSVDGCDRFHEVQAWVDAALGIPGLVESA